MVRRSSSIHRRSQDRRMRQGRLLLVSMLENFCALYDESPERNRRLFYVICKQLHNMGIIDADDFLDELSSVRGSYKRAFRDLVVRAMDAIRDQDHHTSTLQFDSSTFDDVSGVPPIVRGGSSSLTGTRSPKLGGGGVSPLIPHRASPSLEGSSSARNGRTRRTFASVWDTRSSRYAEDFVELDILGKGAFGRVYRVRNRLDGIEYAIKKVRLRMGTSKLERILREVKFQARLQHTNVVRYFSAWVEDIPDDDKESRATNSEYASWDALSRTGSLQKFEPSSSHDIRLSDVHLPNKPQPPLTTSQFTQPPAAAKTASPQPQSLPYTLHLTLLIQMELCSHTLRDFLRRRNQHCCATHEQIESDGSTPQVDVPQAHAIFRDLAEGLLYVHSMGCIHRDIKPKNIYWKCSSVNYDHRTPAPIFSEINGVWKIGDFGLVTAADDEDNTHAWSLAATTSTVASTESINHDSRSATTYSDRTIGVGTVTYASPEQLQPHPSTPYTSASDVYSLGIILFELLHPFKTAMERARALQDLRAGRIGQDEPAFSATYPRETTMIRNMLRKDPKSRPTAQDLCGWIATVMRGEDTPCATTQPQPQPSSSSSPGETDPPLLLLRETRPLATTPPSAPPTVNPMLMAPPLPPADEHDPLVEQNKALKERVEELERKLRGLGVSV
ncbi:kinase-like domain-containing protein [Powellomyces hirtus]|nr:kinase-like domain-containing protein [Powellomyces hirtus]